MSRFKPIEIGGRTLRSDCAKQPEHTYTVVQSVEKTTQITRFASQKQHILRIFCVN